MWAITVSDELKELCVTDYLVDIVNAMQKFGDESKGFPECVHLIDIECSADPEEEADIAYLMTVEGSIYRYGIYYDEDCKMYCRPVDYIY
jgi:hypothetical protein